MRLPSVLGRSVDRVNISCRHTVCIEESADARPREMERRRIPRQVAMKLIGHRTEHIYRRYAIVTEADIQDARERLDRAVDDG